MKAFEMLVTSHNNLKQIKVLISNLLVHLELLENKTGNLFLLSCTNSPRGMVYYATTPSLLCSFLRDSITLQTLFNETPSMFVELIRNEKTELYELAEMEIILTSGDKTIKQLAGDNPIEIWEGC